jgi:hypothetical protein
MIDMPPTGEKYVHCWKRGCERGTPGFKLNDSFIEFFFLLKDKIGRSAEMTDVILSGHQRV